MVVSVVGWRRRHGHVVASWWWRRSRRRAVVAADPSGPLPLPGGWLSQPRPFPTTHVPLPHHTRAVGPPQERVGVPTPSRSCACIPPGRCLQATPATWPTPRSLRVLDRESTPHRRHTPALPYASAPRSPPPAALTRRQACDCGDKRADPPLVPLPATSPTARGHGGCAKSGLGARGRPIPATAAAPAGRRSCHRRRWPTRAGRGVPLPTADALASHPRAPRRSPCALGHDRVVPAAATRATSVGRGHGTKAAGTAERRCHPQRCRRRHPHGPLCLAAGFPRRWQRSERPVPQPPHPTFISCAWGRPILYCRRPQHYVIFYSCFSTPIHEQAGHHSPQRQRVAGAPSVGEVVRCRRVCRQPPPRTWNKM